MREIKFRAWDADARRMLSSEHLVESGLGWVFSNDGFCPMQYTGLKDKNGVDIYEGDIVCWTYGSTMRQGNVTWSTYQYTVTQVVPSKGTTGDTFWFGLNSEDLDYSDIEVIGNIYENPELLEEPTHE